jgi:hypothetical protein
MSADVDVISPTDRGVGDAMDVARTDATRHVRLSGPAQVSRRTSKVVFAAVLGLASFVGLGLAAATPAFAAPMLTVSPDSGVTPGSTVTVTGSGYADNSLGSVLECNGAPGEPKVTLPAPVGQSIFVSCQELSILKLVSTNGSGGFTTTWKIISGTVGPPCGPPPGAAATCPATDSGGIAPTTDAANYPCPPTPAQQAAGVTCYIEYGDATLESAQENFTFAGEAAPGAAPATTAPAAPVTTAAPPTTAAHTTVTTAPVVTPTTAAPAPVVAAAAAPSASPLASTGPGPDLWIVGIIGFIALYLGVWLVVLMDRPNNLLYRWVRRSRVATAGGDAPPEDASAGTRTIRPPGLWVG